MLEIVRTYPGYALMAWAVLCVCIYEAIAVVVRNLGKGK
jgi:hypothetical protein